MAISYDPKRWAYGNEFTPDIMNHIENGIKAATDEANRIDEAKVDKVSGKGLSTNDYTNAEKQKVSNAATAESVTELSATVTAIADDVDRHAFGEQSGGKNIWNEKWNLGDIDATVGQKYTQLSGNHVKSAEPIEVKPNTTYTLVKNKVAYVYFYDANLILLQTYMELSGASSKAFTTPTNTKYICFLMSSNYGTVYNHDLAIVEGGDLSAVYEPYIASNAQLTELADESEVRDAELCVLGWNMPSGMMLKNTVENGVFTQKVGRVDLTTVEFSINTGNVWVARTSSVGIKLPPNNNTAANIFSTKYRTTANDAEFTTMCVCVGVFTSSSTIYLNNGSSTEKPSGYLYYELAEYKTYTLADYPSTDIKSAELQALGWCVPSEMPIKNTLANGVLTQYVGRIEASTLSWIRNDNVYRAIISGRVEGANGAFLDGYTYFQNMAFGVENGMISDSASSTYSKYIFVGDTRFSNVNDFTVSLKGKYLYYVLATPITHRITNMPSQKSMISDAWDDDPSNKVYYVGDLRIDGNRLYECYVQTDRTSGRPSADTAHWRKTSVANLKIKSETVHVVTNDYGIANIPTNRNYIGVIGSGYVVVSINKVDISEYVVSVFHLPTRAPWTGEADVTLFYI